jgi:hypothetical protein
LSEARKKIYETSKNERRAESANRSLEKIISTIRERVKPVSAQSAGALTAEWRTGAKKKGWEKTVLKKYTVADLYQLVVEVATEVLPRGALEKFLKGLSDRLLKK